MVVYQGNVRGLNQLTDCNREPTKLSPTEPIATLVSLVTHAPRRFSICSLSDKPSTFHNATITPVQSFEKPTCGGRHERLLHLTVLEGGRKGKLFLWEILSYLACTRLRLTLRVAGRDHGGPTTGSTLADGVTVVTVDMTTGSGWLL